MALLNLATQAQPSAPSSGLVSLYYDIVTKLFSSVNDAGVRQTVPFQIFNQSVAVQTGFAADTYLTGSQIGIPSGLPRVATLYRCQFDIVKTAAGVAAAVLTLRIGTAGTTADAARNVFTFAAQTAAVDAGTLDVVALFRTVGSGASAVLQGTAQIRHNNAATGLTTVNADTQIVTSAGFDSTVAGSIIGLSVNGGAAAAWTIQLVNSELRAI